MAMALEQINTLHYIIIDAPVNEADIAIAPIDNHGSVGQLNSYVLTQYGYSSKDLPNQKQLGYGFGAIPDTKGKPILFVVTIDGKNGTDILLEQNLFLALVEFSGWIRNKKLWIPLMGTGTGGLTLLQSYTATVRAINRFQKERPTDVTVIISIPPDESGNEFHEYLQKQFASLEQTIEEFLSIINCHFYLVKSNWGRDDQSERFFEEGIWEIEPKDKHYSNVIKSVKVNDIIILKTTFGVGGISYIRVHAMGLVTENPGDGTSLIVDWRITGIRHDIESLSFYKYPINKVDIVDVRTVLSFIDSSQRQLLLPPNSTKTSKPYSIAGLLSDSDKGIDYLDITKDVTAFARVIAARSFVPPLAIALFGKWGSGKSFFMRELKGQIERLSNSNLDDIYCNGIAHIHFNAWSYIDANLWASIVTKIFEGLQQYIFNDDRAKQFKTDIEAELAKQLNITQEELQKLEYQRNSVDEQIKKLNDEKTRIESKLNDKIQQIQSNTLKKVLITVNERFNIQNKIQASLISNDSYIRTSKELNKLIPSEYWDRPDQIYKKAKSASTFIKDFFIGRRVWVNLIWVAGILILVFTVPEIVKGVAHFVSNADFNLPLGFWYTISICAAILARTINTYKRLQPAIAAFWKIKVDYVAETEKAISEYEQIEKALKLQIEKRVNDIASINQQVKQATGIKASLEYKIDHVSTQALYSFIEKRCNSEDYQKHLGIVSVIRKDFEVLSALFNEHSSDLVTVKDRERFRSHFNKPLERIVLYIDDLDRCPEDIVVQVVDAVNLLMAYPLFVVIVGVDPVWIKNALIKKHTFQFTGQIDGSNESGLQLEKIDPAFYLEKIFQIPFHLKDASKHKVRDMIKSLAQVKPAVSLPLPISEGSTTEIIEKINTDQPERNLTNPPVINNKEASIINLPGVSQKDKPEAVEISDAETILLQDIGEIIGENPRAIKRFINTYRVIKAHEDFSIDERAKKDELLVIMFLLALPISNYRKLMKSFETFINDDGNKTMRLQTYLSRVSEIAEDNKLKHNLDVLLTDRDSYMILQKEQIGTFYKHNQFIKRFTFKNI
jgi:hypothetical protein